MMKKSAAIRIAIVALATLLPHVALARMFQIIPPDELIATSTLVFVGKVQSVETSSIATSLSYPTLEGVSFPWLKVEAEVTEPIKGVKKGEIVQVMMLSINNTNQKIMYCPPDVLKPDKGDVFFFCLNPTPITNSFAALSGPYDEFLSIFPLHRVRVAETNTIEFANGKRFDDFDARGDWLRQVVESGDQRFSIIRNLVNEAGDVIPEAAAKLKETCRAAIDKIPMQTVYLEWQSQTNASGWVRDVPKDFSTNSNQQ